jgi:hypothetical protein
MGSRGDVRRPCSRESDAYDALQRLRAFTITLKKGDSDASLNAIVDRLFIGDLGHPA